ncbi:DUF2442 domain-containing protein [bacterium]|nr:MAG: DUF2442 domain-containing protein [bacterium]
MNTSIKDKFPVLARSVRFTKYMMFIRLSDGREIGIPLEWFPALSSAKPEQLKKWKLIGNGIGIHWDELDEDILVEPLLKPHYYLVGSH